MSAVIEQVRGLWSNDDERQALSVLGRVGVAARAALYLVVAGLTLRIAYGDLPAEPDRGGALEVVTRQPFGRVLVAVMALGFAALAVWNLAHAVLGSAEDDGLARRARDGVRFLLYAAFAVTAVPFVLRGSSAGGGGDTEQDVTVRVLGWPGGTLLIGAVALLIIGTGAFHGYRAVTGHYRKTVEADAPEWAKTLATVGRAARSGVFVIVGFFVGRVAFRWDPAEAVGIDGALLQLAGRDHGPGVLTVVAAAIAVYGIYSAALVRYGRPGETDSL